MNSHAVPKQKGRLCGTVLRRLHLRASYQVAALHAKLFERPFWFFEEWRGHLADRIDNEEDDR
jgi:hypothetical protein